MTGICYIVGAGDFYGTLAPRECDFVIAADGGYEHLRERRVKCDLLVGDMDSLDTLPCDIPTLRVPVEKDETDTYLCYLEGVRRGYNEFVIYGGVGGREDHTFANYSLLIGAILQGNKIKLVGKDFDIFAINNEKIALRTESGKALSIFAYPSDAKGVSIEGCKYCASDITLSPTFPLGVSNSTAADTFTIEVKCGTLLIMLER